MVWGKDTFSDTFCLDLKIISFTGAVCPLPSQSLVYCYCGLFLLLNFNYLLTWEFIVDIVVLYIALHNVWMEIFMQYDSKQKLFFLLTSI